MPTWREYGKSFFFLAFKSNVINSDNFFLHVSIFRNQFHFFLWRAGLASQDKLQKKEQDTHETNTNTNKYKIYINNRVRSMKVKGTVHPRTGHELSEGDKMYSFTLF